MSQSIERRLPLLMTAILAAVLATSLALTYRALSSAAQTAAETRLTQVGQSLAAATAQAAATRNALLGRVVRDSALVHALEVARVSGRRLPPEVIAEAQEALARVQQPADSNLPATLWTTDGERVAAVGVGVSDRPAAGGVDVRTRGELPEVAPPSLAGIASDSVHVSELYLSGGRVYFDVVAPVDAGGARLGYIHMLRRISSNPRVATQLRDLTGEDVALYIHQTGQSLWASMRGTQTTAPAATSDPQLVVRGGRTQLSMTATVPSTTWQLTLEEPLDIVLRRPRALVRDLVIVSVLLTLVGVAAAWTIGRRVARPIGALTLAAEAIARGDYSSRAHAAGSYDEVNRLAESFNAMASAVETSLRATNEARHAAEDASRAKGDFLAVMSHELRTPLNAISGYADLLRVGVYGPISDAQLQALGRIARSQQHLLGLIDDVLTFAKLNASVEPLALSEVLVTDTLLTAEAMVMPQLETKGIVYRREDCGASVVVHADGEKLRQIVLNLLSNALKFTPTGGEIVLRCEAAHDVVHISVRDTGVGIPADRLPLIFEPFVQVGRALNRPHEGVGLGLAISRDLARRLGGSLTVESVVGAGSTFTLTVPRVRSAIEAAAVPPLRDAGRAEAPTA